MTITVQSQVTGAFNKMDIPMEQSAFEAAHATWIAGVTIQDAFPELNATQREFIKTGMDKKEQDMIFGTS